MPIRVIYWLEPESDFAFLTLWRAVLTLQYSAVFFLVWASVPLARFIQHFIKPHRHRTGLLQRSA